MPNRIAALVLLLCAAFAIGAAPAPSSPIAAKHVYVAIKTERGTITLDLDAEHAPLTTANFLRYVDQRRFDGTSFYRSMHLDWGDQPNGLVQGGIGGNPAKALKPVAHEPTSQTGILHKAGAISMARYAPGTATGDFSLLLSDMPGLDARPEADDPEARAGFAAFGHVVAGMDVVRALWDAPRSGTKGEGVMKGQMIETPIRIVSVRRVSAPPAAPPAPPAPAAAAVPAPSAPERTSAPAD